MYTLDEIITDGIINKRLKPAELVAFLPTKSVQDIRNRWNDVLDPNLIKGPWTAAEGNNLHNIYHIF